MSSESFEISDASQKTLGEWQQIALSHFNSLFASRKDKNLHVFALEHCFTSIHLEIIFKLLLKDYSLHRVNRYYWLLWTIFSTEIGYEYTGEEYWQSFEEKVKNWSFQEREDIRWAFKEFQKKFSGIVPTGTWANHFSIISLPITHAILPKDLQYYFAKLLFLCRYKLKNISLENPSSIGNLLATHSYIINSSRFQNFLQQEELVGRIALALLNHDPIKLVSRLIFPSTLTRIVSDLEQKRNAKQWVQEARREVKPRILGTGTNLTIYSKQINAENKELAVRKFSTLKPKLRLYQSEENKWDVIIEIPKLSDALDSAALVEFLKNTRVQVTGAKGHWIPSEVLLHGPLKKKILIWPGNEVMLKFEKQNSILNHIIDSDCHLSKDPWLFSIGMDGLATEIEGKILRPGKTYVALFKTKELIPAELTNECSIECDNIFGRNITVPKIVTELDSVKYKQWGFDIFKSLSVWPAGLSAKSWDGEGMSEWLTTDTPCFGLVHDYEIEEYNIQIASTCLKISAKEPGVVTFIKLPPLPAGRHVLSIKPKLKPQPFSSDEGLILLDVKEPVSWIPGTTLYNGLTAFLDPNDEDLDAFLSGKTELKIYGPKNRTIVIHFDFFSHNQIVETYSTQPITLPINSKILKEISSKISKIEILNIVRKVKLIIICEDIGQKEFVLTRNVKPFRWIYHSENNSIFIRLVDETDSQEKTSLHFFNLLKPDKEIDISSKNFLLKTEIKDLNGLFWAKNLNYEHGIVISNVQSPKKFEALSISPTLLNDNPFDIISHLNLIKIWYTAQCEGFLAQIHREKIIEVLVEKLYSTLCDSGWSVEEMNFMNNSHFNSGLEALSHKIANRSIANVINFRLTNKKGVDIDFNEEIDWFYGAIHRCHVCNNDALIRFSLAFVSNPLKLISGNDLEFETNINKLLSNADLLRATRLFMLGISKLTDPYKNYALLIPTGLK